MISRDKIIGTFLGVGIGDALGKPVESFKPDKIVEKYGRVDKYFPTTEHKYFGDDPPGTWTDDTQLTLAVARGILRTGGFDAKPETLDAIAEEHVQAFKEDVGGWGASTREAITSIMEGVHWSKASKTKKANRGVGNGICMKVAPVAIHLAMTNPELTEPEFTETIRGLAQLAIMTHRTSMAITSGFAQTLALAQCLKSEPETFDVQSFIATINGAGMLGRQYLTKTITEDDIANRFNLLYTYLDYPHPEDIAAACGGGTCYVYDSLPFTHMFFLRNHQTIDSLFDCVSAGGDTDSNGSMLAAMLGALHGTKIFPEDLIEGLHRKDEILAIANEFYDKFA